MKTTTQLIKDLKEAGITDSYIKLILQSVELDKARAQGKGFDEAMKIYRDHKKTNG